MENKFFNTPQMRILGMLMLLMAILALGSYAMLNFERINFLNPTPATIHVSGEGEVFAVPDIGQFSFSVNAQGADAMIAQEESGTKINAILTYLTEQGIEDKDVKTQNYNLNRRWKYEERVCPVGSYCPGGERVQDGFEVTQTVSIKVRDIDMAVAIIAGVGERGATNISSLNFTIDDEDALQAEARAEAITDAQVKAEILAEQLGVRLVRLVAYDEGNQNVYKSYAETRVMSFDSVEDQSFGGAELPVGEESVKSNVNITYEVK